MPTIRTFSLTIKLAFNHDEDNDDDAEDEDDVDDTDAADDYYLEANYIKFESKYLWVEGYFLKDGNSLPILRTRPRTPWSTLISKIILTKLPSLPTIDTN